MAASAETTPRRTAALVDRGMLRYRTGGLVHAALERPEDILEPLLKFDAARLPWTVRKMTEGRVLRR